jgi:hypothetical protein
MNTQELKEILQQEIKGLHTKVTDHDFNNCIADAQRETGWTLPVTSDFQVLWMKQRAKRHLFFYLWSESAHKFKFESINLQHRFAHYKVLIEKMDKDFDVAFEANPQEFAGAADRELFGTKFDAGFSYDNVGGDVTYNPDNLVIVTPSDND